VETPPPGPLEPALEALARRIPLAMLAAQHRLRSRLRGIERVTGSRDVTAPLAKLTNDLHNASSTASASSGTRASCG
jgi:hypothetical protein